MKKISQPSRGFKTVVSGVVNKDQPKHLRLTEIRFLLQSLRSYLPPCSLQACLCRFLTFLVCGGPTETVKAGLMFSPTVVRLMASFIPLFGFAVVILEPMRYFYRFLVV